MSPLCSSCRSEAEFTTTGSQCSRCGEPCDNCGEFTSTNATAPVGGLTSSEALRDPVLAFILGMATMGLVFAVVVIFL